MVFKLDLLEESRKKLAGHIEKEKMQWELKYNKYIDASIETNTAKWTIMTLNRTCTWEKSGDICEKIYLNSGIFGTKVKAKIYSI